jgi:hypothetical protein
VRSEDCCRASNQSLSNQLVPDNGNSIGYKKARHVRLPGLSRLRRSPFALGRKNKARSLTRGQTANPGCYQTHSMLRCSKGEGPHGRSYPYAVLRRTATLLSGKVISEPIMAM